MGDLIDITEKLKTKAKPLSIMEIDQMRVKLVNRGTILAAKIVMTCMDHIKRTRSKSYEGIEFELQTLAVLVERENDKEFRNDLETALLIGRLDIAIPTPDFNTLHIMDIFSHYVYTDDKGEILDIGFQPNPILINFSSDAILGAIFTAVNSSNNKVI